MLITSIIAAFLARLPPKNSKAGRNKVHHLNANLSRRRSFALHFLNERSQVRHTLGESASLAQR
jgi:hypothetical protein